MEDELFRNLQTQFKFISFAIYLNFDQLFIQNLIPFSWSKA